MSLHVKQSLLFLLLCINLMGKHLVKDLTRHFYHITLINPV
jgi:hypothetical protein